MGQHAQGVDFDFGKLDKALICPVFQVQIRDTGKFVEVIGDEHNVQALGVGGNEQGVGTDGGALLGELGAADTAVNLSTTELLFQLLNDFE